MIKILKASAGSGKTYMLALEYIRLLVAGDNPDAYRHVLAVTFTNKATDEMKRRILKELHGLATDPAQSSYRDQLVPAVAPDLATLQKRARTQLHGILHDYSAFAVSTIDKFFQQTLRAFSREIGQFSSYQVQLDRESLLTESVDRVLDGISEENTPLLDWLTRSVQDQLQQSGHYSLDGQLKEMAASLQKLPPHQACFPREHLEQLRKLCQGIRNSFPERVKDAASLCLQRIQEAGLSPEDTYRGFLTGLYAYAQHQPGAAVSAPKPAFVTRAKAPDQWFTKDKKKYQPELEAALEEPLNAFLALFDLPFKEYYTAGIIQKQLYGLGVADELRSAFVQIQKEKNVISIDDSNTILRGIIDGTDTPFIYEKLGVRYEDFLLDEFQDTADVQWENIRPLLHGSDDAGNASLVVGDVKQSIYRWRGSDWNLLGSRLEQEFRQTQVETLKGNFRTCRQIVQFNNTFFADAASRLDGLLGQDPAAPDSISSLYRDVAQEVRFQDPAPGSVEVCFTQEQDAEILSTLQDLHEKGWKWADIAILVRKNAEGAAIADSLVRENIPVVSDDSLYVKASVTVRRLISQLSLVDSPVQEDKPTVAGFLAQSMAVTIPPRYHSLVDLAEGLLRDIRQADPATFEAEVPYIQSFMDYLQEWVSTGGNNLAAFLRAWEEASPMIASPQTGDSVRVMTVHKSKGLEFPFVLFPYAEKVTLFKASTVWSAPGVEGTALAEEKGRLFRVSLDQSAASSLFEADYRQEQRLQAIDAINLFYVALTRAKYGLKIVAAPPPENLKYKDFSQFLYAWTGSLHYTAGQPYDPSRIRREASESQLLTARYDSFPADSGKRLSFSPEAVDYFGEDGSFGPEASKRIRGNVLHGILSRVMLPHDLPSAVDAAIGSGELPGSLREQTLAFLQERIASVQARGWFSQQARVQREQSIFAPDGGEYRPDRVVMGPDGNVQVVDYKFGVRKDSYKRQVSRYMQLYRAMGHTSVSGFLWYLEEGQVEEVSA